MTTQLLEVRGLGVEYAARGRLLGARKRVTALSDVSLALQEGGSLGIVGESGCGKSTLARAILGLVKPGAGEIRWRGWTMDPSDRERMRQMRRDVQVVFQDPFGSLDPRMTAGECVAEALEALEGVKDAAVARSRVTDALASVGLDAGLARRYPHELSGGQCQRVAIARATVAGPRLLICDEAVSALDVSVQAQVVNLLGDLCRERGIGILFISHNLAVVRHLCEEIVVLYLGRVVERGRREQLFRAPLHPYTRALLVAVPEPVPGAAPAAALRQPLEERLLSHAAGAGCDFAPRCPLAVERCRIERPVLLPAGEGAAVACHRWQEAARPGLD